VFCQTDDEPALRDQSLRTVPIADRLDWDGVVDAGAASFLDGPLITMGIEDVARMAERVPTVIAVHMEAINHCALTRSELAAALPEMLIPADGGTIAL
jgi:hypothetical protein